ncbi:pyrroloquinoline quinone precursor peptide PqqA [Nocardiopsis salina]|nr:pyrroloquinoline quinone precursor peptide PqqA [Nocardiopsis salina]
MEQVKTWESPTVTEVRVSAEATAYVAVAVWED